MLIEAAVLDPSSLPSAAQYLPGYDGKLYLGALAWLLLRLLLALYLLASALARFDRVRLLMWEWIARLVLAALIMFADPLIHGPAAAVALAFVVFHSIRAPSAKDAPADL